MTTQKKINLSRLIAFLFIFGVFFFPTYVIHSQGTPPPPQQGTPPPPGTEVSIKIPNPLKNGTDSLYEFIRLVINDIVLPLGGVIATLYIMYAGFLLVTARGDEKQITQGKLAFLHAAIGTAILLGAWVIAGVIENTINTLTT